jgi:hypothetical protein
MLGSQARLGVTWAPTTTPIPNDGANMTVHRELGHGSHGMTRCDPGHSSMTVYMPL